MINLQQGIDDFTFIKGGDGSPFGWRIGNLIVKKKGKKSQMNLHLLPTFRHSHQLSQHIFPIVLPVSICPVRRSPLIFQYALFVEVRLFNISICPVRRSPFDWSVAICALPAGASSFSRKSCNTKAEKNYCATNNLNSSIPWEFTKTVAIISKEESGRITKLCLLLRACT
ncbi:hypothetical protein L9F63_004060, partial [Diploptera punctata]